MRFFVFGLLFILKWCNWCIWFNRRISLSLKGEVFMGHVWFSLSSLLRSSGLLWGNVFRGSLPLNQPWQKFDEWTSGSLERVVCLEPLRLLFLQSLLQWLRHCTSKGSPAPFGIRLRQRPCLSRGMGLVRKIIGITAIPCQHSLCAQLCQDYGLVLLINVSGWDLFGCCNPSSDHQRGTGFFVR